MSVQEKMTAIADAIRAKTGKSEALTLERMAAEIAGIQAGDDSGGASGIYMAQITPAADSLALTVTHNLGTTDILLATCFAETLGEVTPTVNKTVGRFWAKTDIPHRYGATSGENYQGRIAYLSASGWANVAGADSDATSCSVLDENTFHFVSYSAAWPFIAGVTYTVIVVAANAEV